LSIPGVTTVRLDSGVPVFKTPAQISSALGALQNKQLSAFTVGGATFPAMTIGAVTVTMPAVGVTETSGTMATDTTQAQIDSTGETSYKMGLQYVLAMTAQVDIGQVPTNRIAITITGAGARRAEPLAATVAFVVCNGACTVTVPIVGLNVEEVDDEFPGWGIALCVILPLLAIGGIVGGVLAMGGMSGADGEQSKDDEELGEKPAAPYGDDQGQAQADDGAEADAEV